MKSRSLATNGPNIVSSEPKLVTGTPKGAIHAVHESKCPRVVRIVLVVIRVLNQFQFEARRFAIELFRQSSNN